MAEKLLCQDMDEGKHNRMTPKALHESQNEFHEWYPLAVFVSIFIKKPNVASFLHNTALATTRIIMREPFLPF